MTFFDIVLSLCVSVSSRQRKTESRKHDRHREPLPTAVETTEAIIVEKKSVGGSNFII